jgi:hypothetical protein
VASRGSGARRTDQAWCRDLESGGSSRATGRPGGRTPPRHANIVAWPTNADPELQKAQQKEIALAIASQSTLVRARWRLLQPERKLFQD